MKHEKKELRGDSIPSIASKIIDGLHEFKTALVNREKIETRFTVRTVELDLEPYAYNGDDVKNIRKQISVSQAVFAQMICVPVSSVRAWEQNKRQVPKMACRLMDDIRDDPQRWIKRLNIASRHQKPACHTSA